MLEEPAVVSEPVEVIEHRLVQAARGSHAAGRHAATLAVMPAGQLAVLVGDDRPQQLRRGRGGGGGHLCRHVARACMTERSAAAIAAGSRCGTSRPAPAASISLACGNCVATTGLPAATASMSTPEVTCSVES